MFENNLSLD